MQQPFITGKQPMFGGRSIFFLTPSQKTLQQYMDSIGVLFDAGVVALVFSQGKTNFKL